ncbi:MAG: hypothetical protein F6K26_28275 [Moorea sp. SIO2I5]|nr:hypothetical protein [Moorena sp. SIO2I5]
MIRLRGSCREQGTGNREQWRIIDAKRCSAVLGVPPTRYCIKNTIIKLLLQEVY